VEDLRGAFGELRRLLLRSLRGGKGELAEAAVVE
jgi:hypothetical protein